MSEHETRTYRGRTLEGLLPKIRAELGPDAVVVRQREGLAGGVGGFFQKQFVEVEARRGAPRVDLYDDPAEAAAASRAVELDDDAAEAEGLESPAIRQLTEQAAPFADALGVALQAPMPRPVEVATAASGSLPELLAAMTGAQPVAVEVAAPPAEPPLPPQAPGLVPGRRPPAAAGYEARLVDAGLRPQLAAEVVAAAVSHGLPFAGPRQLKRLVRAALASRLPVLPLPFAGARTVVLAGGSGAGKTLTAARLAVAYAHGSDLPARALALGATDGGQALRTLAGQLGVPVEAPATGELAAKRIRAAGPAFTVVDLPALSPAEPAAVLRQAAELAQLGDAEVHLVLPATLSAPAARQLLEALRPLRPTALVLTRVDETTAAGAVLELAIDEGLPVSYVGQRTAVEAGLAPADAAELAQLLLP
jgi:flagellar biosynthesis GTPase FlhF